MQEFLNNFRDLEKDLVKIVAYSSIEGMVASSILIRIFNEEDIKFSLSFIKSLDKNIEFLKNESFTALIFLGFKDYKLLEREFKDKKILVFCSDDVDTKFNCLKGDIIENCYLLSKKFIDEDLSYLVFMLNNPIESDLIVKEHGIKINNTISLLEALSYGFDLFIPEISGEEDKIRNFLQELKIDSKVSFLDLRKEERDKLCTAILINMLGSHDLNEETYSFKNEKGLLKCIKEFKSLLGFLSEINKESLGIGVCLGDENSKKIAIKLYLDYKKAIITSLKWFYKNRKSSKIIEKKNFVFINGGDDIKDIYLKKILDLLASFKLYSDGTLIFGMCYTLGEENKVALKLCGNLSFDARKVLKSILKEDVNGEIDYAWTLISQNEEKKILARLFNYGENLILEEKIK